MLPQVKVRSDQDKDKPIIQAKLKLKKKQQGLAKKSKRGSEEYSKRSRKEHNKSTTVGAHRKDYILNRLLPSPHMERRAYGPIAPTPKAVQF